MGNDVKYNNDKVDETVLALLCLTTYRDDSGHRAWKGQDWEVMNRLHERGYIDNPRSKSRSVALTEEGRKRSEELFRNFFGLQTPD